MVEQAYPAETSADAGVQVPWHLWAIGVVSLLWNFGGVYDYTMTELGNADYLADFSPEELAYFTSFGPLRVTFWALGVWGSFIGSILLLLRSRRAVLAFVISLFGLAASTAMQMFEDMPASLSSPAMAVFTGVIWAIVILLLWYAMRMRRAGVLR